MPEADYNYESFAETPEYRRLNRKVIAGWIGLMSDAGLKKIEKILDIATGIGTMVRIFLEELPESRDIPAVVCLDKSSGALEIARQRLEGVVSSVDTIHSPVQKMEVTDRSFSVVLWGNGIHNLSVKDQREAVRRIAGSLGDDGWFFFNSAFYEGARPEGTLSFYRYQIKHAVKGLRGKGVTRNKDREKAEAAKFHPREHYSRLLEDAGFSVEDIGEITVPLYQKAWEYISGFRNYATGALHGYPVEEAQKALQSAVRPALEKHGKVDEDGKLYIPRKWLNVAGRIVSG